MTQHTHQRALPNQPDDIGGVVAFLSSDDARLITGDTIRVDGGDALSCGRV
jgi:NAD(P)-dependent dehydrogenase (short-subunit alcohol dehydrogenase family)